nr:hypothetical protein [Tanacetum cinerariifolium]
MLDNIMGLAILVNSKACRVVCLHLRDKQTAHFLIWVPSHIGRPNLQTTIETQHDFDGLVDQNIPNRGKRQQLPSKQELLEYMNVYDNDASESSQPSWEKMCTSGT